MDLGKHHATITEFTYNRLELADFYKQFTDYIMNFGDYMQYLTPDKREFRGRPGMNAVNVHKKEGKYLQEYDIIKNIINKFDFGYEISLHDVDLLHYDPGFEFHPHTDHFMKCGIMFPILPDDAGEPIVFYEQSKEDTVPRKNYSDICTEDDIVYEHYYSNKHPTLFNGHTIHGVRKITKERVYLRIKILHKTFEEIVDRNKLGILVR